MRYHQGMDTEHLSDHVTSREAIASTDRPDLIPANARYAEANAAVMRNARMVALFLVEEILLGMGIALRKSLAVKVLSFIRCPELNRAVGGSAGSQHQRGAAVDFTLFERETKGHPAVDPVAVFRWIVEESGIVFHQCYYDAREHFIHIGLPTGKGDFCWWWVDKAGTRHVRELPQ